MTSSFDQNQVEVADGSFETRTFTGDLLDPTTPNEEQETSTKPSTVLVNGPNHQILDIDGDLEIRHKLSGHGIAIDQNGDIYVLTAPGSGGRSLGGRFIVNAHNGAIFKSGGPICTEALADSGNPVEGDGSESTGEAAKQGLARSDVHYGDWITETHGELRLKATNIVIEATDVLSLIGGSVLIQGGPNGGGEVAVAAGSITELTSIKKTAVLSQNLKIGAGEDTDLQFDPRATRNIVSTGHLNVKTLGDLKLNALGCGNVTFGGVPAAVPLIKANRLTGFGMSVAAGSMSISTKLGSLSLEAGGVGFPDAGDLIPGSVSINAKGNTTVKGKLLYLN